MLFSLTLGMGMSFDEIIVIRDVSLNDSELVAL